MPCLYYMQGFLTITDNVKSASCVNHPMLDLPITLCSYMTVCKNLAQIMYI